MSEREEKFGSLERYEDPLLETLGELLDQLQVDGAMDLEELDGFFTALQCAPQMLPREVYLPEIFGSGESLDNNEVFSGPDSAKLMWQLISNFWTSVHEALLSGKPFIPLLTEDDDGMAHGNNWAKGFMHGVEMGEDLWEDLLSDESKFSWIAPIITLREEELGNPDPRLSKTLISQKERELLLNDLSTGVSHIYRYFAKDRAIHTAMQNLDSLQPIQKPGRNDPCYCGSGLKYKKCCGGTKVN